MNEQHSHEEIREYSPAEVLAVIKRGDVEQLSRAVVGVALHVSDSNYAEDLCVRLAVHDNSNVRGNAILGLGHLARRFGQLNIAQVKPIIESFLSDQSEYVRGQTWAAADDITHFLGWDIVGFDEEG